MDKFITREKRPRTGNDAMTDSEERQYPCGNHGQKHPCASAVSEVLSSTESEEEMQAGSKSTKRNRNFRENWANEFPWVEQRGERAFCLICEKFLSNLVTHLRRHAETPLHKKNYLLKKDQTKVDDILNTQNETMFQTQVQTAEYCLILFVLLNHLPISILDSFSDLFSKCFPDSKIAKNIKCKRTKATCLIKEKLSTRAKTKISDILKNQKFSLIADETTDVSTSKALALVARYFDKLQQRTVDIFFGLVHLKSGTAESIFAAIKNHMASLNIPIENVVGLATDNASVMVGEFNGLFAKFKSVNENIFCMRCICHSLHLCASQACKKLPADVEKLAREVYVFFSHSAKRVDEFAEFQNYVGVKNHKIFRMSEVRWLSFQQVVDRLLSQWNALQLYFISCFDDGINNAKEIAEKIGNPSFKLYFYFLSNVLGIVNKMNVEFQSQSYRLHRLHNCFEANYKLICSFYMKTDCLTEDIKNIDIRDVNNYLPLEEVYLSTTAQQFILDNSLGSSDLLIVKKHIQNFYIELCHQISKRYDFGNENIKDISCLDPNQFKNAKSSVFLNLLKNFPGLFEAKQEEKIFSQWQSLKFDKNVKILDNIESFWGSISLLKNAINLPLYDELSKFVFNILSLPHSSAAAERIFSDLKLTKNDKTNRLSLEMVENIMFSKALKNEYF